MAVVGTRSSLVAALLGSSAGSNRHSITNFLEGLSCDELRCIAEFHGACIIESELPGNGEYRMLAEFFDAAFGDRWPDAGERAHKTFIVLAWLDLRKSAAPATISFALS